MSSELQRGPFTYRFFSLNGPYNYEVFQKAVDPNKKLRQVNIQVNDTEVRKFFWKRILRDLSSADNSKKLYQSLLNMHTSLEKKSNLANLGITFEPSEDESSLKVMITPYYKSKMFYKVVNHHQNAEFSVKGTIGINNVTGLLDTLSLNWDKGWYGTLKDKYCLEYRIPTFYKDYSLGLELGRDARIFGRGTLIKSSYQKIGFFNNTENFSITNSTRYAEISPLYHSREFLEQGSAPYAQTIFTAFKVWKIYIDAGRWVSRTQTTAQMAFSSNSDQFLSLEGNNYSVFFSKGFLFGGALKLFRLENSLSFGVLHPLRNSKASIFNRFCKNNLRGLSEVETPETTYDRTLHPFAGKPGFEFLGDYRGDDIYLKETVKLCLIQTKLLEKQRVMPFLYLTCGYFSGDLMNKLNQRPTNISGGQNRKSRISPLVEELIKKGRLSVGVGIQREIDSILKAEALVNLHSIGMASDRLSRFQLRLTIFE